MIWAGLVVIIVLLTSVFWLGLVHREVHIWFWSYAKYQWRLTQLSRVTGTTHVMFCFVDHFEPLAAGADDDLGMKRVERWVQEYRRVASAYRDSDDRYPSHSFFYPEEEYRPQYLDAVAGLCRDGFGEVEVHLHHDHDTAARFKEKLVRFTDVLHKRHGVLTRDGGQTPFAFIHGNWALDNSRRDGRWCGIDNELIVLREAGCYADFTLPSAPSDTQTRTINTIYYAKDDPLRGKSHDTGTAMKVGGKSSGDLLIFQGPLALHWRHRKFGIWPRIENSDIAPNDIPIEQRLALWVRQNIHVDGRPEWIFIKVHTHGAIEENADYLFGGEFKRLFDCLDKHYNDGVKYMLHYVSAREAYNIAKAAEAGRTGNPAPYRDFILPSRI